MDRTAALARLQAISARRTVLLVELTELQAEETQLRKFFRVYKTTAVLQAILQEPVADESVRAPAGVAQSASRLGKERHGLGFTAVPPHCLG